jgi:hypothetical protein
MNAIGQAMRTKAANGTISNISVNTVIKSAIGSQAAEAGRTFFGAIGDAAKSKINNKKR